MKLIIAIIQPTKLEAVKEALSKVEVFRLTVMDVQGFGRQKGYTEVYRGHEVTVNLLRKIELQIAVNEDFVEPTVNAILRGGPKRPGWQNRRWQDFHPPARRLHPDPDRRARAGGDMKGIGAVIFDFNGVLIDDESVHFSLFREILAQEEVVITERDYHERYLGYDDRRCFEAALLDAGKTADRKQLDRLIARKAQRYIEVAEQGLRYFPAAAQTLSITADRWPVAICSGALRSEIEYALQRLGCRRKDRGNHLGRGYREVQARPNGLPNGTRSPTTMLMGPPLGNDHTATGEAVRPGRC